MKNKRRIKAEEEEEEEKRTSFFCLPSLSFFLFSRRSSVWLCLHVCVRARAAVRVFSFLFVM